MNYKIIFPTGYQVTDLYDDNIDVNVICDNASVFFGTLFTISNIKRLLDKSDELFFWATDMIIIKDLDKASINSTIGELVTTGYLEIVFTKIGDVASVFPNIKSYDDVEHMC